MLITQSEFARIAKVSRSAVCQAVKSGLITATEIREGKIYIHKDDGLKQYESNSKKRNKPKPIPVTLPTEAGLEMLSWGASAPASENSETPTTSTEFTYLADDNKPPDYTVSRARSEHEKANLLELERRTKEGELVYRADFVTAQNAVAAQIMNRAENLPRQIKQAIPHLLVEEVEKIERLIKEMMEGVANWSYAELEAEE